MSICYYCSIIVIYFVMYGLSSIDISFVHVDFYSMPELQMQYFWNIITILIVVLLL